MNRAVLGAGHGLTVTLEIRHSVIPGGFVRACARREHPPSFGEPLSCDHYFRLSRSASLSVLTSHPSSFNSSMRRLSPLDVSSSSLVLVLAFSCARESMPEMIYHTRYSIHRCNLSIVVYCAEREASHLPVFLYLLLVYIQLFSLDRAIKRSVNHRS